MCDVEAYIYSGRLRPSILHGMGLAHGLAACECERFVCVACAASPLLVRVRFTILRYGTVHANKNTRDSHTHFSHAFDIALSSRGICLSSQRE